MVLAGKISRLWRVSLRQDAGVGDDRIVCHHLISRPLTASDGSKIQVRLRHVLRKDPTISYVEYLMNLNKMSLGRACVAGTLNRNSYEIQMSYVCKLTLVQSIATLFRCSSASRFMVPLAAHVCRNTRHAHPISSLFLASKLIIFLLNHYHFLLSFSTESQYYIRSLPTRLGHFEFKTLRSLTVVRLGIGGSSSRQELRKNLQLPQATPEALLFFFGAD